MAFSTANWSAPWTKRSQVHLSENSQGSAFPLALRQNPCISGENATCPRKRILVHRSLLRQKGTISPKMFSFALVWLLAGGVVKASLLGLSASLCLSW